jgi:hypothetical protein
MARYVFLGPYETNVELPDGSVVLVEPGDVVALDFDDPGPLWANPTTGADVLKGAALTKALTDAGLPKTGTADEKRAALAALSSDAAPTDPAPPAPPAPTEPAPAAGATPADLSTTNTAPTDPATPAAPEGASA